MSSLLKGKTKQSRRNSDNRERQNLLGGWKEMESVCYYERAESVGIMLMSPWSILFLKLYIIQALCETPSCL